MAPKQSTENRQDSNMVFIDDLELSGEYPIDFTDANSDSTGIIALQSSAEDGNESSLIEDSLSHSSLAFNSSSEEHRNSYEDHTEEYSSFDSSGGTFYNEEYLLEDDYSEDEFDDYDDLDDEFEGELDDEFDDEEESYYFSDDPEANLDDYDEDSEYSDEAYWEEAIQLVANARREEQRHSSEREYNIGAARNEDVSAESEPDEHELVILESRTDQSYPRVTYELITMILVRMYMAYNLGIGDYYSIYEFDNYPYNDVNIASKIRDFTHEELDFLKLRVSSILMNDIRDVSSVQSLINLISVDEIDNISISSFKKTKFKSTMFKDMISVDGKSCGICYCDFRPVHKCTSLQCLHTFHTKCIKKWVAISWCCPLCRRKDIG